LMPPKNQNNTHAWPEKISELLLAASSRSTTQLKRKLLKIKMEKMLRDQNKLTKLETWKNSEISKNTLEFLLDLLHKIREFS
jgi:hypothetical protein